MPPATEPADGTATVVTSKMSAAEIIAVLVEGQYCSDITNELDLNRCGNFRAADGGLSDIYQGALAGGKQVAIKCPRILVSKEDEQASKILKQTARELYTWSRLKHRNILELCGLASFRGYMAMVSPWMDKGTLLNYIGQDPKANRWKLCVGISEGLAYLHKDGVKHGDMKSMNILVSGNGVAKVSDFGCTELKCSALVFTATDSKSGTARWSSPEKLENGLPSKEDDVYALGLVLLEIITGEIPFSDVQTEAQLVTVKIIHKRVPSRPTKFPTFSVKEANILWEIALDTWAHGPSDRPSCKTVATRLKKMRKAKQPKVASARQAKNSTSPTERGKKQSTERRLSAIETVASPSPKPDPEPLSRDETGSRPASPSLSPGSMARSESIVQPQSGRADVVDPPLPVPPPSGKPKSKSKPPLPIPPPSTKSKPKSNPSAPAPPPSPKPKPKSNPLPPAPLLSGKSKSNPKPPLPISPPSSTPKSTSNPLPPVPLLSDKPKSKSNSPLPVPPPSPKPKSKSKPTLSIPPSSGTPKSESNSPLPVPPPSPKPKPKPKSNPPPPVPPPSDKSKSKSGSNSPLPVPPTSGKPKSKSNSPPPNDPTFSRANVIDALPSNPRPFRHSELFREGGPSFFPTPHPPEIERLNGLDVLIGPIDYLVIPPEPPVAPAIKPDPDPDSNSGSGSDWGTRAANGVVWLK